MLWYKFWLDTRWRFLIGLVLLTCSAGGVVFVYPTVVRLLPSVSTMDLSGAIGRRIKEAADIERDYRGYIWYQWFGQNLTQMGTLFAVLLGSGGTIAEGARGAALFTLSMPVSRHRLLGVRAATGLGELLVLVFVASLVVPILSPAVGESYGVGQALIHGLCLFTASTTFFSLALLLSTWFSDLWRPLLVALGAAVILGVCESALPELSRYGLFAVMRGETYFRAGDLPWLGLLASTTLSVAMLSGAATNLSRRDF